MSVHPLRILVVGRGRVGRSLARAWRRSGHTVALRAHGTARAMSVDAALLSVPDCAVTSTAFAWAPHLPPRTVVFHAAGALDGSVLDAAKALGMRPGSLHPLVAVADTHTDFGGAWATVDGAPDVRRVLSRLARDAGLRILSRSPTDRVRYHLGAALAANSQPPLLEAAVAQWIASGMDERSARDALAGLAHGAIDAWLAQGGPDGLTGPVARGDATTVRAHLAKLRGDPTVRSLYEVLSRAALGMAAQRTLVPPGMPEVARALGVRSPPQR